MAEFPKKAEQNFFPIKKDSENDIETAQDKADKFFKREILPLLKVLKPNDVSLNEYVHQVMRDLLKSTLSSYTYQERLRKNPFEIMVDAKKSLKTRLYTAIDHISKQPKISDPEELTFFRKVKLALLEDGDAYDLKKRDDAYLLNPENKNVLRIEGNYGFKEPGDLILYLKEKGETLSEREVDIVMSGRLADFFLEYSKDANFYLTKGIGFIEKVPKSFLMKILKTESWKGDVSSFLYTFFEFYTKRIGSDYDRELFENIAASGVNIEKILNFHEVFTDKNVTRDIIKDGEASLWAFRKIFSTLNSQKEKLSFLDFYVKNNVVNAWELRKLGFEFFKFLTKNENFHPVKEIDEYIQFLGDLTRGKENTHKSKEQEQIEKFLSNGYIGLLLGEDITRELVYTYAEQYYDTFLSYVRKHNQEHLVLNLLKSEDREAYFKSLINRGEAYRAVRYINNYETKIPYSRASRFSETSKKKQSLSADLYEKIKSAGFLDNLKDFSWFREIPLNSEEALSLIEKKGYRFFIQNIDSFKLNESLLKNERIQEEGITYLKRKIEKGYGEDTPQFIKRISERMLIPKEILVEHILTYLKQVNERKLDFQLYANYLNAFPELNSLLNTKGFRRKLVNTIKQVDHLSFFLEKNSPKENEIEELELKTLSEKIIKELYSKLTTGYINPSYLPSFVENCEIISKHVPLSKETLELISSIKAFTNLMEKLQLPREDFRDILYGFKHIPPDKTEEYVNQFIPSYRKTIELTERLSPDKKSTFLSFARRFPKFLIYSFNKFTFTLKQLENSQLSQTLKEKIFKMLVSRIERGKIEEGEISKMISIFTKIENSLSLEVKRIKNEIIDALSQREDYDVLFKKIEDIFIKNNLPYHLKVNEVFQILHNDQQLIEKIRSLPSKVLNGEDLETQKEIIKSDLLRIGIDSNNRSLLRYIQTLSEAEDLFRKIENGHIRELTFDEYERLSYALLKINRLNENFGGNFTIDETLPIDELYYRFKEALQIPEEKTLSDGVREILLSPLGYSSFLELRKDMEEKKKLSSERNKAFAKQYKNKKLEISEGHLLKGVNSLYIENIIQNGSLAKEFLGGDASSDRTPLDTDLSLVLKEDVDGGLDKVLSQSLATSYGDLILGVIPDNTFINSDILDVEKYKDEEKKELRKKTEYFIPKFALGERHIGIRTGFGSNKINYLIYRNNKNTPAYTQITRALAKQDLYIPIFNSEGELIFSEEDFIKMKKPFEGISYYNQSPQELIEFTSALLDNFYEKHRESQAMTEKISQELEGGIVHILTQNGIFLRSPYSTNIEEAVLENTGSTGRGTNTLEDFDFDYNLSLNAQEFLKVRDLIRDIKSKIEFEESENYTVTRGDSIRNQLKLKKVTKILERKLPKTIDLDISFTLLSQQEFLPSHNAIKQKFQSLKENYGEEKLTKVKAQIGYLKRYLKNANVYGKKNGYLGGIAIENLILEHGANLQFALKSFVNAAYENGEIINLNSFKEKFKIIDPGLNLQSNQHDNFTFSLQDQTKFEQLVHVMEKLLSKI